MSAGRIMAVAAGVLLLHACGDDAEALSKPEFIEQADAICASTSTELDAVFDQLFEDIDAELEVGELEFDDPEAQDRIFSAFAEGMEIAEPIFDHQVDELRALRPPDEDRDLVADLLDDLEAVVDELAERIDAAAAGDASARAFVDSDEDPFADVNARARAYGFTECGDPSE